MKYCFVLLLCSSWLISNGHAQSCIDVENAWITQPPPTVKSNAGYLTVKNNCDSPVELVSVTSPAFEKIEIHSIENENGRVQMKPQASLIIDTGGEFTLAPASYHLMMHNSASSLSPGDEVRLILGFRGGARVDTTATVKTLAEYLENR